MTTLHPSARGTEPAVEIPRQSTASSHDEHHTDFGPVLRDITIGFADGLTVPFALTAGLSSLGSSNLVVTGGLAELFSGAISMGLGAYLAAATESTHYRAEEERERREVSEQPEDEKQEIYEIMRTYGISKEAAQPMVDELSTRQDDWVRFMMDFELRLEKPKDSRAWVSAATMGASYFLGGLVPMLPYFAIHNVNHALFVSIGISVVILLVFGFLKNYITIKTTRAGFWGAVQTLGIGVAAAAVSYGIVRGIDASRPVSL